MNNYQKAKMKIEMDKFARRVNEMTPLEKEVFICNLKQDIFLLESQLLDLDEHYEYLNNVPEKREMSTKEVNMSLVCHTLLGVLAGLGVGIDIDCIVAGGGLGFLMFVLNGLAYEMKPVSKRVNEFRKYLTDKKMSRIEDEIEKKTYLQDQIEELELSK